MHAYHFSDALNYSHARLSEMHNASFQGYFVPLEMTARMSADFWRVNQVDAALSVVMHESEGEERFVGLARVGSRGKRGWCGGFGIVPDFRGSGASSLLAAEMVRVARANGLETLQLEVLAQNTRAIRLYEKTGFVTTRRLLGLEIACAALPAAMQARVERVPLAEVLPAFCASELRPAWSNELPALLALGVEAWRLTSPGGERAAILLQRANDKARVVAALPGEGTTTPEVAAFLQIAAGEAQSIQVYNEPEESPLLEHCRRLGFGEWFTQYEMLIKLQAAS